MLVHAQGRVGSAVVILLSPAAASDSGFSMCMIAAWCRRVQALDPDIWV